MKTLSPILISILFVQFGTLVAETTISFPKSSYTIREIVDRVQHETPYNIVLPFADTSNEKKILPPEMGVTEVLRWITRYYEKSNHLLLHFDMDGENIRFQKSLAEQEDKIKTLFKKKIVIKGRNWSIHDAMQSVSNQVGLPLDLPAEVEKGARTDYDYECTVEEWVAEVRQYWVRQWGRYLSYRMDDRGLSFIDAGPAHQRSLEVELLGKIAMPSPDEVVPAKNLKTIDKLVIKNREAEVQVTKPSMSQAMVIKDVSAEKTKLPVMEPKLLEPLDRWVEPPAKNVDLVVSPTEKLKRLSAEGPLVFLSPESRREFMTELIRPRPLAENVGDLLELVRKYVSESRGLATWFQKFSEVDLDQLSNWDRKKALRETEEMWLSELLKENHEVQSPSPSDRGWHGKYSIEVGVGSNPQAVGDIPLRPIDSSSMWLGQYLEVDYRYNPVGPWQYSYGISLDHVMSDSSIVDDWSWSGLGFHFNSTKTINSSGIAAISPFFSAHRADDFLLKEGWLEQNLFVMGMSVHWAEMNLEGPYKRSYGTTDLIFDQLRPQGMSAQHFLGGSLRQESLGIRHRQIWLTSDAEGQKGPGFELYLLNRGGDHPSVEGVETGLGLFWKQKQKRWNVQYGLDWSHWARQDAVDRWNAHLRCEASLFSKGISFANFSVERSDSLDPIMDYDSTRLTLGWEYKW